MSNEDEDYQDEDSDKLSVPTSSSEDNPDSIENEVDTKMNNLTQDKVAGQIIKYLNIVEDNPWYWDYKPGRDENNKVWGRFSMIFPLKHGGCTLGILHGSHLSTKPIHLSQATRVLYLMDVSSYSMLVYSIMATKLQWMVVPPMILYGVCICGRGTLSSDTTYSDMTPRFS